MVRPMMVEILEMEENKVKYDVNQRDMLHDFK